MLLSLHYITYFQIRFHKNKENMLLLISRSYNRQLRNAMIALALRIKILKDVKNLMLILSLS